MNLNDYHYDLPDRLIARHPPARRTDARLLVVGGDGALGDGQFSQLRGFLGPCDLLVLNDTRVIRARLRAQKATGGAVEVLVERIIDQRLVLAHVKASKTPKIGAVLTLNEGPDVLVSGRHDDLFELTSSQANWADLLEKYGEVPLPPYLGRAAEPADVERYQTVFAAHDGAVAAPTAGLHFDNDLLEQIVGDGVGIGRITLHVGAGTFQTIRDNDVANHVMHAERYEVSESLCEAIRRTRDKGGRVVAVGTTVVRALEAAASGGDLVPSKGDTRLFIAPGFEFRVVDAMVTNFHLPATTLMMLVAAFAGREQVLRAYVHAVANGYRFFSYGDAMFLSRVRETP
jgi:S-adenosylmethionine:tRNA ribosyltransferase-isomerase